MRNAEPVRRGLAARGLACARGGRELFAGLSFELPPGTALQVRGSNGSGKSSLLRLLCGLLPPERGELQWDGMPSTSVDSHYGQSLAFMGHASGLCGELTARENLRFTAEVSAPATDAAAVDDALQAFGIGDCAGQFARRLSQGQRQRVALARVLLARRPLWLLDEPCAALDDEGRALFRARLGEHLGAGGCAVIATHDAITGLPTELPTVVLDDYFHGAGAERDPRA
jgi:heme exporter protein A